MFCQQILVYAKSQQQEATNCYKPHFPVSISASVYRYPSLVQAKQSQKCILRLISAIWT